MFINGLIYPIFPNLFELSMLLVDLPVPIERRTISSLGNNFLLFAYAQAEGLLANTPPSISTLSMRSPLDT
jgi:hypothetical protein